MIKSFKHKGLEDFFLTGSKAGINPNHENKLARVLFRLKHSKQIADMNLPGYRLHKLTGNYDGFWSIVISGNYRLIFQFNDGNANNIDYIDYH